MKDIVIPVTWVKALCGYDRELQEHGYSRSLRIRSECWYESEVQPVQEYLSKLYPGKQGTDCLQSWEHDPRTKCEFFDSIEWFFQRLEWSQIGVKVYFDSPPESSHGKRLEIRTLSKTSNVLYFVVYEYD